MADLDFRPFDADNHYYEAEDAFTRHIPKGMAKRTMQWAEIDGKKRLLVAGKVNRFIPNPTFDPVAKPGCLDDYFRGKKPGEDIRSAFGELDPISPAYRDRDARVELMDQQGLEGAFLFPTLGVGMEESLKDDPEACHVAFHSFNQWLVDDWGFAYQERLFTAPYITLVDPEAAAREVEWAIAEGARVVVMRSAPVPDPNGSRSPADPIYDPVWRQLNDAGVTVAYHSGDAGYHKYQADWGLSEEMEAFRYNPLRSLLSASPIHDLIAALIAGGLFARFPNLRVATIESGSTWVPLLFKQMRKSYGQMPGAYAEDPIETFRRHVWVAPYYEDDLHALAGEIGVEHVIFGSDYPHAEGLADPTDFVHDLDGFDADAVKAIMRDNAIDLAQRAA